MTDLTSREDPISGPTQRTRPTPNSDWPAQLRLPGQAAAPEGPVDVHMMYVAHFCFRRDLTAFASAAAATPLADRRTWSALAKRWDLFATVLHHHHQGEDAGLWPLLAERADEEGRATLAAMEAEHDEIDPILDACSTGFARLAVAADPDTRNALVVRLCAGRESLGRHLAHEESSAMVLVQELLTQDDWDRLEAEHFRPKQVSPMFILCVVPWIAYGLPSSAREVLLAHASLGGRLLWRLTRGWFRRGERRAFRYLAYRSLG